VTILVVEDEPHVLSLIDRLLTIQGHLVIGAHDPDDATFMLTEHKATPDLLLTDIILAADSGIDYAKRMKAMYPSLKVVFMTGWPHREPSALRSNLGPVLRKPFKAEELYAIISR